MMSEERGRGRKKLPLTHLFFYFSSILSSLFNLFSRSGGGGGGGGGNRMGGGGGGGNAMVRRRKRRRLFSSFLFFFFSFFFGRALGNEKKELSKQKLILFSRSTLALSRNPIRPALLVATAAATEAAAG